MAYVEYKGSGTVHKDANVVVGCSQRRQIASIEERAKRGQQKAAQQWSRTRQQFGHLEQRYRGVLSRSLARSGAGFREETTSVVLRGTKGSSKARVRARSIS